MGAHESKLQSRTQLLQASFLKKDDVTSFRSDFSKQTKQVKDKPCPKAKIPARVPKLKSFHVETSFNLSKGYHQVIPSAMLKALCIILPLKENYEYQRLLKGNCYSKNEFHQKMLMLRQNCYSKDIFYQRRVDARARS
jgi:hypothetical protein